MSWIIMIFQPSVLDLELPDHPIEPIVSADMRGVRQSNVGDVISGSSFRDDGSNCSILLGDGIAACCPGVNYNEAETRRPILP